MPTAMGPQRYDESVKLAMQLVTATQSDFYDAFVSVSRGMFNTRSRIDHTRKRKIVSHIFSQKNVLDFEINARMALGKLIKQWDRLCDASATDRIGSVEEGAWFGRAERVWFDCLPWYNYLAFDIIGDLAFGAPFGMLEAARDIAPVALPLPGNEMKTIYIPAVQLLNMRGDFSASMGVLPPWVRPLMKYMPWYAQGGKAVRHLHGIAVAAVEKRLADPAAGERGDLLARLQNGKDEDGNPMGKQELIAEALTQLIAGSDTTSKCVTSVVVSLCADLLLSASCGITYYLARHPDVQRKLQAELDEALGLEEGVVSYESVKKLRYLDACIFEAQRVHSASGLGLPRIVPEGGLEVCGKFFKEGTVLSVPTYSIHRDEGVWGKDVDSFWPERWLQGNDVSAMQKTFNTFSFGPR